jgi:hypothetical protein
MDAKGNDSAAIVDFINRLTPLYADEVHEQSKCARALRSGTLIRPAVGPSGDEDAWVEMVWAQGAQAKATVRAVYVAQLAIGDYIEFHTRGNPDRYASKLTHLFEHFELKTGKALSGPQDPLIELLTAISNAIRKNGVIVTLELVKKLLTLT